MASTCGRSPNAQGRRRPRCTRDTNKHELLRILRDRQVIALQVKLNAATTTAELCRTYLAEAEAKPRDYELIFGSGWRERTSPADVERFLGRLVDRITTETRCGGVTARRTALQVWLQLHGAATQRASGTRPGRLWREIAATALDACAVLIGHAATSTK